MGGTSKFTIAAAIITGAVMLPVSQRPAYAVDMQPGDYIPAPAGTDAFLVYLPYGNYNGAQINGRSLSGGFDSYAAIGRYVHFLDIGGMRADVNVVVPYVALTDGSLASAPLKGGNGLGDIALVSALWLYNDPKANHYVGVAAYLNVPAGRYDRYVDLNVADNRWSGTFQIGSSFALDPLWSIEGIADVTFFGDNKNSNSVGATLSQAPTVTAQMWLNYQATPLLKLSAGYGLYTGGNQYLNDIYYGFNAGRQQARVAASYWLTPKFQFIGQVNTDFAQIGGFKQDVSTMVRLLMIL
jgi:hypothetical protein